MYSQMYNDTARRESDRRSRDREQFMFSPVNELLTLHNNKGGQALLSVMPRNWGATGSFQPAHIHMLGCERMYLPVLLVII